MLFGLWRITYAAGTSKHIGVITDYSQVEVIHSTSGEMGAWQTYKVHKSKWSEIEDKDSIMKSYQLRRLTK